MNGMLIFLQIMQHFDQENSVKIPFYFFIIRVDHRPTHPTDFFYYWIFYIYKAP